MAWDQADQPTNGQTGTKIEAPAAKPTSNESVHSLFISDFLTDGSTSTSTATSDVQKKAPEAAPKVTAAPKPAPENPLFDGPTDNPPARMAEPPRFAAPVQTYAPPMVRDYRPATAPTGQTVEPPMAQNFRPSPGRDMTYSGMVSRAQQMAQFNPGDNNNSQLAARPGREGGLLRRIFQPAQPQPPQDGRRQPPGVPQEQDRQRLFGRPNRGDAPAPKNEPMQKIEFKDAKETGIVKEMNLPAKFKEVPKDPNLAAADDPIIHEYAAGNSRVSLHVGRQLSAAEQATLKAVLAKPGPLTENVKGYEDTLMMMGFGYANFTNNPQVAVGKFQGREALILSDSDPQSKQVTQTIFVRSDTGSVLYPISFQGAQADFPAVKKGLETIKWRPTPDVVTPPAPGPKR